jgi:hypothetical protein
LGVKGQHLKKDVGLLLFQYSKTSRYSRKSKYPLQQPKPLYNVYDIQMRQTYKCRFELGFLVEVSLLLSSSEDAPQ